MGHGFRFLMASTGVWVGAGQILPERCQTVLTKLILNHSDLLAMVGSEDVVHQAVGDRTRGEGVCLRGGGREVAQREWEVAEGERPSPETQRGLRCLASAEEPRDDRDRDLGSANHGCVDRCRMRWRSMGRRESSECRLDILPLGYIPFCMRPYGTA